MQSTRHRIPARLFAAAAIGIGLAAGTFASAGERPEHDILILTSSNDAAGNVVEVFALDTGDTPSLSLLQSLPTGGKGGAGGNAGSVQFDDQFGAVANFGSASVTRLARSGHLVRIAGTIPLADGCTSPDSVALAHGNLYVVGAECAESHDWPSGQLRGDVVALPDASAGQIVVGRSWAAVTLKSGSVQHLSLDRHGALSGSGSTVNLPASANDTPLGAAFWGDLLGFTPAHSADSFALVTADADVHPIAGPAPAFPSNAPCWVAKGPGSIWYTGNTPDHSISIFLSDGSGGVFYKSVPLAGAPTDLAVSQDQRWLAVIYSDAGNAYVEVFAIDRYGDLTPAAVSSPIGIASFNGVAFSG